MTNQDVKMNNEYLMVLVMMSRDACVLSSDDSNYCMRVCCHFAFTVAIMAKLYSFLSLQQCATTCFLPSPGPSSLHYSLSSLRLGLPPSILPSSQDALRENNVATCLQPLLG